MPLLPKPSYQPSFWQFSAHIQTIYPSIFRKVDFQYQHRERLELADGDFVDLDWARSVSHNRKLLIITHGLEGDSKRHYVLGMAKLFYSKGYDVLAWNCRSCSGEMNRLPRFYHHGDAGDLKAVITHSIQEYGYEEIILTGFSMGGSLTLRALGEDPEWVPAAIKKAIAFSVPIDLLEGVKALARPGNGLYAKRFLKKLGKKIKLKEQLFPGQVSYAGYENIKTLTDFDHRYSAPLHGFRDAFDFYARASVKAFLPFITLPTLLVQSLNDPFLTEACMGYEAAAGSDFLFLETPENGGHCGFMLPGSEFTWAEWRAYAFATG